MTFQQSSQVPPSLMVWGTTQKPDTTPNKEAGNRLYKGCFFGGVLVTTKAGFSWLMQVLNARVEPLPQVPLCELSGNRSSIEHRLIIHRVRRARDAAGERLGNPTTGSPSFYDNIRVVKAYGTASMIVDE